LFVKIKVLLKL